VGSPIRQNEPWFIKGTNLNMAQSTPKFIKRLLVNSIQEHLADHDFDLDYGILEITNTTDGIEATLYETDFETGEPCRDKGYELARVAVSVNIH